MQLASKETEVSNYQKAHKSGYIDTTMAGHCSVVTQILTLWAKHMHWMVPPVGVEAMYQD